MNLHPCPLCGESKGYVLRDGDTFSEWVVACADCGERVSDCDSDRRPHIGSILPDSWPAADAAWNAAAAHAQGLRERIAELENEAREQALQALASEGQWIEQTGAQQKRIAELERDNDNLKTVMVAAAEEIHAHWDAHCDAEGYGPQNLMRRLEEGIPSEYGYTAGAFAAQQKRIAELENEAREQALQALASEGQWMEQTGAQQKRIAELEAQRVPQWISVNDRLPEKFIEVLICFAGQSTLCATGQYTDNHRHDVAGWCYPAENRGCTDSGDDPVVTHWMPLPPPPVERAHGIEEAKR